MSTLTHAIEDFCNSGLTPEILGIGLPEIMKGILPLEPDLVKELFPNLKMVWDKKNGKLRTKKGYIWHYNGTARLKNLDPEFVQFENGVPKTHPITGLPEPIRYLGAEKVHLYMDEDDLDASKSPKGCIIPIEGEKKTKIVRCLLNIVKTRPGQYSTPHITQDFKYSCAGGSGIFNFIPSPEWKTLNVRAKPTLFILDSDWESNTNVALAEIKMLASLVANGASISRMRSFVWPSSDGKGIDDYLINIYRQANIPPPFIESRGKWEPTGASHPMLSALNELFRTAIHPFKKYESLGLEFICYALTSIYRKKDKTGKIQQFFSPAQEEEIILQLHEAFGKRYRMPVIRATFTKTLRLAKDSLINSQTFQVTESANGERLAKYSKDSHIYNFERKKWMTWTGKIWEDGAGEHGTSPIYQAANEVLKQTQAELAHIDGISDDQRRELSRKLYGECQKRSHKLAIIGDARDSYPWMQIKETSFDVSPYLLNLSNCVIHLDKIKERPEKALAQHMPGMYCSRIAPTNFHQDAQSPKWSEFIDLIFDNYPRITGKFLEEAESYKVDSRVLDCLGRAKGETITKNEFDALLRDASRHISGGGYIGELAERDLSAEVSRKIFNDFARSRAKSKQGLVDFVQQVCGLGLSGLSTEKILLFAHGKEGDNGKSTFFNIIEEILGCGSNGYFYRIDLKSVKANSSNSSNNEGIANLKGKRFVVTTETDDCRLDVALLKNITGAENTISASRKWESEISFPSSHTFWLMGNEYPTIAVMNDPFWKRVKVVPFIVSLPSVLSSKKLLPQEKVLENFRKEKSGILNWMLEGWCDYRNRGLTIPDEVKNASKIYQGDQDDIRVFLTEQCIIQEQAKIKRGELYATYCEWCGKGKPLGRIKFYRNIESRGFEIGTEGPNDYYFYGLGIGGGGAKEVNRLPACTLGEVPM